MSQFALAFIVVPSVIVITFMVLIWRFWNKSYLNLCMSILVGSVLAVFAFAIMGAMALEFGSPELVIASIALAQAIPLFVAVFLYAEGSAHIERVKLHDRIWVLENRLRNNQNKRD